MSNIQDENQLEKNISCNVFLEQIELLNELPANERGNVLYLALLKAFSRTINFENQLENQVDNQDDSQLENQVDNQDDSQLENHLDYTYISISKSISLSKLSISVLNLLNKTLDCKTYSKRWGGKRTNTGRPQKKETLKPEAKPKPKPTFKPPTLEDVEKYCSERKNNVDAKRFFDYYTVAKWKDQDGKPVKNWKQKIIAVWEKRNNAPPKAPPSQPKKYNPYYNVYAEERQYGY